MPNPMDFLNKLADDILTADAEDFEKYSDALDDGIKGAEKAIEFLSKLKKKDAPAVQAQLTEWADVNRTLLAVKSREKAIEDAENGIQLKDVLEGAGKVLETVVTIRAFLP